MKGGKGPPPDSYSVLASSIHVVCVLVSLPDSRNLLIDGTYRGRDISDSEVDELSKLQGVEIVPHEGSP